MVFDYRCYQAVSFLRPLISVSVYPNMDRIRHVIPNRRLKLSTAPGFMPGFCFLSYRHSEALATSATKSGQANIHLLPNRMQLVHEGSSLEHFSLRLRHDWQAGFSSSWTDEGCRGGRWLAPVHSPDPESISLASQPQQHAGRLSQGMHLNATRQIDGSLSS